MRTFRLLVFTTILGLIVYPLDFAHTAPASTFTATSVLDTVDANPGDGICADAGGNCTLRAAVMEANASAGQDTIELLADTYTLAITGDDEDDAATGDLDLNGTLTITGTGAETTVIDGNDLDRVFQINAGATVTISGFTIQNGDFDFSSEEPNGGGIYNEGNLSITNSIISNNQSLRGGGIYNTDSGDIRITNSTIYSNQSVSSSGGIFNLGEITIINSTISGNQAGFNGGGIGNYGVNSIIELVNTTISGNKAISIGGGVQNTGSIKLVNSIISDNFSYESGGGISVTGVFEGVFTTIINSTISGNKSDFSGGGISMTDTGEVTIVNSTISYNGANGFGGGIYIAGSGTLEARNATVVANTANADADGLSRYGGGIANVYDNGSVRLYNTILASNIHVIENDFGRFAVNDDCKGTLNQLSYSLLATETGCTFTSDNSITGQNPKLEALADNDGPTQTHALKPDSPAIDAGDPNGCKDHDGIVLTTDQRGELRPFDGDQDGTAVCDIGAYEYLLYQALTVDKAGTGDGRITSSPAGVDCGETCNADLLHNSVVTLTAEPEAGSSFISWSGACNGTGDCQLTLDAAKNVTATFELNQQLTVTKAGEGDGSITSSPSGIDCGSDCSAAFAQETLVTLTAAPQDGSTFTGWNGACAGTGDCQVNMDAEKSVTATFAVVNETAHKLFLPMSLR